MRVLHLVGSPTSSFLFELSRLYAKDALRPAGWDTWFAVTHPDGTWGLGRDVEAAGDMDLGGLLRTLPRPELVVPHLYCRAGMTTVRGLFEELLGCPVVGSSAFAMGVAADKIATRTIAQAAGVRVAEGEVYLEPGAPRMQPPYVVKPSRADNSVGLSLVRDSRDGEAAVRLALDAGCPALVERFIPGREIRTAVIETDKGPIPLPSIEYQVTERAPIRGLSDKLALDDRGRPVEQASGAVPSVCPAEVSPSLRDALGTASLALFEALPARDYALFDFRVDPCGQPVLLEAGLFWSFGPRSMISRMLEASGLEPRTTMTDLWARAARRSARTHPRDAS